jgi:hypothetical protein
MLCSRFSSLFGFSELGFIRFELLGLLGGVFVFWGAFSKDLGTLDPLGERTEGLLAVPVGGFLT